MIVPQLTAEEAARITELLDSFSLPDPPPSRGRPRPAEGTARRIARDLLNKASSPQDILHDSVSYVAYNLSKLEAEIVFDGRLVRFSLKHPTLPILNQRLPRFRQTKFVPGGVERFKQTN